MPIGGSTLFGGDLKAAQSNILIAGIPLFQLLYPGRARWEESVFGPINVNVEVLNEDGMNRVAPRVMTKWRFGGDAYVKYERIDRTTAVGWMPDDPFWHNRLFLMDTKGMLQTVMQQRLPNNDIKTASEVKMEIGCLEEVLKESVPVWNVLEGTRVLGSFDTKEELEAWIKVANTAEMRWDEGNHTMIAVPKRKRDYKPQESTKRVYKKNIVELRTREKARHQFGWTQCSYFQDRIKPEVIERIKSKRESMEVSPEKVSIADALKTIANLPAEEKLQLQEALRSAFAKPQQVTPTVGKMRAEEQEEEEVII